jgi:hypothetical protein
MICRSLGLSCLVFALFVTGCGSPQPDDLIKQSIRQWEEAAEILEGVSDEASLREADDRLAALAQKMVELNKKAAAQELDAEKKAKLIQDNRKQEKAALKRYHEAALKMCSLPGGEAVLVKFRRMSSRTS